MTRLASSAEQIRLRRQLVQAAAEEHRLYQLATAERRSERRWLERAALAGERGLAVLGADAEARAMEHRERAGYYEAEFFEQRDWVERLRQVVRHPELSAAAEVGEAAEQRERDAAERQLAALEKEARLDRDLAELKDRMGMQPTSGTVTQAPTT